MAHMRADELRHDKNGNQRARRLLSSSPNLSALKAAKLKSPEHGQPQNPHSAKGVTQALKSLTWDNRTSTRCQCRIQSFSQVLRAPHPPSNFLDRTLSSHHSLGRVENWTTNTIRPISSGKQARRSISNHNICGQECYNSTPLHWPQVTHTPQFLVLSLTIPSPS